MPNVAKACLLIGLMVVVLGFAQFIAATVFSADLDPNPVGSGMLMTACWFAGLTIAGAGLYLRVWRFPYV